MVGSPNVDGNTARLVNEILAGAAEYGAETKMYNLTALDIKGCDSCCKCQESGKCAIEDDMQILYEEIRTSDAVVLGSPVYMWQMSGQTKIFVDRLMAFLRPDFSSRIEGKKLILAFTQGNSNRDAFCSYFEYTAGLLYFLGFDVLDTVVAAGTDNSKISNRPEMLKRARESGRRLVPPLAVAFAAANLGAQNA